MQTLKARVGIAQPDETMMRTKMFVLMANIGHRNEFFNM